MIITCPECETKYRYDERRFDGVAVKQVKCTSCGFAFSAANPTLAAVSSGTAGDSGEGDETERAEPSAPSQPEPVAAPTPPDSKEEENLSMPTDPRYSLAVIAGGQAGSVFQIRKTRIFLGRGSAMDVQLRDSEVSRRHAVLEVHDPEVSLTDLEATNGTWFGGAQIHSTNLGHQDEFTLGSTTLMLIVTPVRDTP